MRPLRIPREIQPLREPDLRHEQEDHHGRSPGQHAISPASSALRRGRPSLLVADDARVNARGLATAKRGRRRRDGMLTGAATVVLFILVPQVRLRKRLDLDRDAAAAAAALPSAIPAAWDD